eukprot:gene9659-10488_t
MGHIYMIDLTDLPSLKSLNGLGKANRTIAIDRVNRTRPIDGFHLLQNVRFMKTYSYFLKDSTGVDRVQELFVHGSTVDMKPENITDLVVNDIPDAAFFTALRRCKFFDVLVGDIKASQVRFLFEQVFRCSVIVKFSLSSFGITTCENAGKNFMKGFESNQMIK